jgi:hypothetical protein
MKPPPRAAVTFRRYMLLSAEERCEKDDRAIGELFILGGDAMPDMRFSQVLSMMLEMLRDTLNGMFFLSEAQIEAVIDSFIAKTPSHFRILTRPNRFLSAMG